MSLDDYLNLFADAGITNRADQEKYSRYLDAAIAQAGIKADDIIGVGEAPGLHVVSHHTVTRVYESGMFKKKRVVVSRVAPTEAIEKLATMVIPPSAASVKFEGRSWPVFSIKGWDSKGQVVLEITWGAGDESQIMRQREHLYKLIGEAAGNGHGAPDRPSISAAASKAAYLMDWAADVVKAAGVQITRERIEEHAEMAAAGIRFYGFLKLGTPYGIDDLAKFYPSGEMPSGTMIETLDDLYGRVVALVGDARLVDQEADQVLASAWGDFVAGCREKYP